MVTSLAPSERRDQLRRWALWLAYATIAWNTIEAIVAIAVGAAAGSVGLLSFGFDSTIEVASAAIVVWQFRGGHDEARERTALRAIAISFFALAAYATIQSIIDLATRSRPGSSIPGIVLAAVSSRSSKAAKSGGATTPAAEPGSLTPCCARC